MGFLTGKTAIITGAGRAILKDGSCGSIGYGIATAYAKEGANLVITGRNVKKLEAAKQELESLYGIKVLTVQADVCAGGDNEATVANVVKQAVDTFGGIQVLINNAQASASGVPLAERDANWYAISAMANSGAGNRVQALADARRAAAMDPTNPDIQRLLRQIESGGTAYATYSAGYPNSGFGTGSWCADMCLLNLCCNPCFSPCC